MSTQYPEYTKTVEKIKEIMSDKSISLISDPRFQFEELYSQYLQAVNDVSCLPLNPEDMLFKIPKIMLNHYQRGTSVAVAQQEILDFISVIEKEFKTPIASSSATNECSCSPRDLFQQGCLCGAFKRK